MKVSILFPYNNRLNEIINTLDNFNKIYKNDDLEIVIVDDKSNESHRLESKIKKYKDIEIKLIRNETPGINPCEPYNIAACSSVGEVLILSSPEIYHLELILHRITL